MKRVFKYLKPHIFAVLLCFAMLGVQAACDLSLPNLMSDMVNVGIQQGGIEKAAPEAVSENGMKLVTAFMEDEESFTSAYKHVLPNSSEAQRYEEDYPLLDSESVYILEKTTEEKSAELEAAYGDATYRLMKFLENAAEQQKAEAAEAEPQAEPQAEVEAETEQNKMLDEETGIEDVHISQIYAVLPALEQLPKEQLLSEELNSEEAALMGEQVGITFTRLFYEEVGINADNIRRSYILGVGGQMLLVALIAGIAAVMVGFLSSRIASKLARDMRRDVFSKVESFSSNEFDKFSTASLITRTTNDIQQVQMLVIFGLRMLAYPPIMASGSIFFAIEKSSSLSWIIMLAIVIMFGLLISTLVVVMPKFKILQKLTDKLNLVSRENLSGMLVIRAFGNEKHEEARFEQANNNLSKTNLFTQRTMALMSPVMSLVMNMSTLLIVWFGGNAIANSTLQIGDMMAFIQYAMHIIMSFLMIAMMFVFLPRAAVSAKRIDEVLSTENEIKDKENPETLGEVKGLVEYRNVEFRYPNAEESLLEDISFTARPGETTAFIGSTGSGKSTLINLLPRFYDVTGGSILVDGKDIRDVTQAELRENIGYVPQKGLLFSGTIDSNVRYGKEDATEDEMKKALDIAQASDFVFDGDKDGLETTVAQGGTSVSGGQRQRLSIARAVVKEAPIYVFDDSFSALDFKTDSNLRKALKENLGDSTILIVAQRVSTIMGADQIIVLDGGKMVGKGKHEELLVSCPEYKEIADSQLQKEG